MPYNFKNIIFEGGGVKGIAYGGALKVLDEMKILQGVKRVAGTSAGAINASLLSVGYTYKEVADIIASTSFNSFKDKSWFFLSNFNRLLYKFGFFKGDAFSTWLGDLIEKKTGNKAFTFGELQNEAEAKGFKELFVVATNLTEQKGQVLSHESNPDLPIRDAVRMSMGIPIFFKSFSWKKNIMVDGGVSWNYPINIFDYKTYLSNPANGDSISVKAYVQDDDYVFNYETLGFRLDSKTVIDYEKHNWALQPQKIGGIKDYTQAVINFMMETANNSHLHQNDWNRTVFIDSLDIKTTQFDLTPGDINNLTASGEKCTRKYFEWRDGDALWSAKPR